MDNVIMVVQLGIVVLMFASLWFIFVKAGEPGWKGIIPIANGFFLMKLIGKEWFWALIFIIPMIGMLFAIYVSFLLAQVFGKGIGFTVGLILLPFIFYPLLAFGDATYTAPASE
jgi:hypothetical protein